MGDNSMRHASEVVSKGVALERSGNLPEAVSSYKEAVTIFTTASQQGDLSDEDKHKCYSMAQHYQQRISTLENSIRQQQKPPIDEGLLNVIYLCYPRFFLNAYIVNSLV